MPNSFCVNFSSFFERDWAAFVSPRSFVKKKNGKRVGRTFFPKIKNPFKHEEEYFCGFVMIRIIKKMQRAEKTKFFLFFMLNFICFF